MQVINVLVLTGADWLLYHQQLSTNLQHLDLYVDE